MKKTLKVSGMHCKSCEMLLADALSEIGGIKSPKADSKKGEVAFELGSPSALEKAIKAIEKEGYKVTG